MSGQCLIFLIAVAGLFLYLKAEHSCVKANACSLRLSLSRVGLLCSLVVCIAVVGNREVPYFWRPSHAIVSIAPALPYVTLFSVPLLSIGLLLAYTSARSVVVASPRSVTRLTALIPALFLILASLFMGYILFGYVQGTLGQIET